MSLSFPSLPIRQINSSSKLIRQEQVNEAIAFASNNNPQNKEYTLLYRFEDYDIKVGKPGKEVALTTLKHKDGTRGNNANDMTPTIFRNNIITVRDGSFREIFRQFIHILRNRRALEILGCLCVRNAFSLDHVANVNGNWRYAPNEDIINELKEVMPSDFPEPVEVFLFYIETIALNEDVKYFTLGYNPDLTLAVGRKNNLLTYANLIRVMLSRETLSESDFFLEFIEFSGRLMSPPLGVHPLALKNAFTAFPQLKPIE